MLEIYRNYPDVSLVTSKRDFIDINNEPVKNPPQYFEGEGLMSADDAVRLIFITCGNYIGEPTTPLIRKKFLRDNDLCWFEDETGFYPLVDVSTWLQLLTRGNMYLMKDSLSAMRINSARNIYSYKNRKITAMYWAELIKYCWEKKIFLDTESDTRLAFFHWINLAATALIDDKNYTSEETTALEDLNIAMAEALHNGCQINLPPSVEITLEKYKGDCKYD